MIEYRLTFTKEKDGVIDKNFTTCAEYVLSDKSAHNLNLDPEPLILEHLADMLHVFFLKAKDEGDLSWT